MQKECSEYPGETLKFRLARLAESGSKADKALATYMLGALQDLPFETASSLAEKAHMSEATVSRFCRTLGYQGFRALKEDLKSLSSDYPWLLSDRLGELQRATRENESFLSRGLELEIAALVKVYEFAATEQWREVVARLSTSQKVFVCGFQTERGLAQYFANQLHYVREGVVLLDVAGGNFSEMLLAADEGCLVLFEARRYSKQARLLAEEAANAGMKVTLITDLFCDWGGDFASEVFAIPTQINQFWDSSALMASFGNLLINEVCATLGADVLPRLNRIAGLYGKFVGHVGHDTDKLKK
ncbi:MurR/RpiR family transcriptional regulator [Thioclava sp. GXIMD4215]|uniref:MurR/RpiR family transcriptional regulator n=1 Tax=Thioclava sp. GXIMD4215 TaxID=3131928 RepID=UPI00311AE632